MCALTKCGGETLNCTKTNECKAILNDCNTKSKDVTSYYNCFKATTDPLAVLLGNCVQSKCTVLINLKL